MSDSNRPAPGSVRQKQMGSGGGGGVKTRTPRTGGIKKPPTAVTAPKNLGLELPTPPPLTEEEYNSGNFQGQQYDLGTEHAADMNSYQQQPQQQHHVSFYTGDNEHTTDAYGMPISTAMDDVNESEMESISSDSPTGVGLYPDQSDKGKRPMTEQFIGGQLGSPFAVRTVNNNIVQYPQHQQANLPPPIPQQQPTPAQAVIVNRPPSRGSLLSLGNTTTVDNSAAIAIQAQKFVYAPPSRGTSRMDLEYPAQNNALPSRAVNLQTVLSLYEVIYKHSPTSQYRLIIVASNKNDAQQKLTEFLGFFRYEEINQTKLVRFNFLGCMDVPTAWMFADPQQREPATQPFIQDFHETKQLFFGSPLIPPNQISNIAPGTVFCAVAVSKPQASVLCGSVYLPVQFIPANQWAAIQWLEGVYDIDKWVQQCLY